MPDLSSQLRAYYEATTDPVDVEAIVLAERPALRLVDAGADGLVVDRPPLDLQPSQPSRALMAVAAVVGVVALGVGLFVAGMRAGRSSEPADAPPPVATTTPTIEEDGTIIAPAEELGLADRRLEPGRYRTDLLGVEVAFDVPTSMLLSATRANAVVISDGLRGDLNFPPSTREWTPDEVIEVRFMRIGGWSTREEATSVRGDAASIDPYDVDAWIAENDVIVVSDESVRVAGRDARVLDVGVDPGSTMRSPACWDDYQPCFLATAIAGETDGFRTRPVWISAATSQRIVVVPIDGFEPLVIFIAAPTGSGWLDVLQTDVVGSLTIGPDAAPIGGG